MFPVIFGMVVVSMVAIIVMALVAIPARREGRDVLISRSEKVLMRVHESELRGSTASASRENTESLASAESTPEEVSSAKAPA